MTQTRLHTLLALRSIIYALINIMPSGVALLVMPLITLRIAPAEYGIGGLYLSIITGFLVLMEYSLILRKAYIRHDEGDRLSESLTACILIYALAVALLALLAMLSWERVEGFIPLSRGWILAALATAGMQAVLTLSFALLQIAQRVKHYCLLKLVFTLGYTGYALAGLFVFDMGWQALAFGSVLGTLSSAGVAAWRVRPLFRLRWLPRRAVFAQTLRSALALMPFRLALAIFTYGGVFLVAYAADTEQSGLYLFAFQICNIIALVYDSVLTAIVPTLVAHHSLSPSGPHALDARTRRRMAAGYVLLVCLSSLGLAAVAPFLIGFLFPSAYGAAVPFIAWIACARCFHGINRITQELSFFDTDHFRRIALVSLLCALCYVAATLLLLDRYGGIGAGMGLAAGHGLWLLALLPLRRRRAGHSSRGKQAQ